MNPSEASLKTKLKVGIFSVGALGLIGLATVFVNDKPTWWRPCQLVHINVEDATGLKAKSAVRSLGLEIGYLQTVILSETHVQLGICITEKVEVLPTTRAYIRGEGFLGDKFVELKPVKYVGKGASQSEYRQPSSVDLGRPVSYSSGWSGWSGWRGVWRELLAEAHAADPAPAASPAPAGATKVSDGAAASPATLAPRPERVSPVRSAQAAPKGSARQIPVGEGSQDVQTLVKRVDSLVDEMTTLTHQLKGAFNPEDLKATMKQLNRTLENASKTLAPEGGLTQTAQRTLAKLEDAIDQLRDLATRINQGQGSLGMLLNDPTYAEEIREVIRNANKLLGRASGVRFVVDVGGESITGYSTGRGWFRLGIWPSRDRYYLLGISTDPRGRLTHIITTTTTGGVTAVTDTTQTEQTGILPTAMLGKVFWERLDLSLGALNGDGAVSAAVYLGTQGQEDRFQARFDLYSRGSENPADGRVALIGKIWKGGYARVGFESFKRVGGQIPFSFGAGVSFDDEDIKLLFAFR